MKTPEDDAKDCARYLRDVRAEEKRFGAAVDDYLARHNGVHGVLKLRGLLADAYSEIAPDDAAAQQRIRGQT